MTLAPFPLSRPRRLRQAPWIREMVAEVQLAPADLIWPVFVRDGEGVREPVASRIADVQSVPGSGRGTVTIRAPTAFAFSCHA